MKENGRPFTAEPILAKLSAVNSLTDEAKMAKGISEIMVMCSERKTVTCRGPESAGQPLRENHRPCHLQDFLGKGRKNNMIKNARCQAMAICMINVSS